MRVYLPEIASQYRNREMIARIRFPGYGAFIDPGFSTDLSETCTWLSSFVKEPDDSYDLRHPGKYFGVKCQKKYISFS